MQEISEDTLAALREFIKNDPMKCEIIGDAESEFSEAVDRHAKEGRRLAAVSNAGLPAGKRRLTFLPQSAFVK